MRTLFALMFLLTIAWAQRISPGDTLQLYCEMEPTLNVTRTVSDAGTIDLPTIGRMTVAGKFVAEAEAEISQFAEKKLGLDGVRVLVSLVSNNTTVIEYSGAVEKAGSMVFHTGMTVEEVYRAAKPTGSAGLEEVEIRSADGTKTVVDVSTTAGLNTRLKVGDRVFFPMSTKKNEVFILGAVEKPGSKPYKPGMTLKDLIELGGGITGHGEASGIQIAHADGTTSAGDISPGAPDILVQRGDAVTVALPANLKYVTVRGLVGKPGAIPYKKGMKLTDAIREAGGLSMFGRSDKIIVRRVGEVPYWVKEFNLIKIKAKQAEDIEIHPADIIEVPVAEIKPPQGQRPAKPKGGHPVVPPR